MVKAMTTVNSPFSYYSIKVTSQLVKHVHPNMGQDIQEWTK